MTPGREVPHGLLVLVGNVDQAKIGTDYDPLKPDFLLDRTKGYLGRSERSKGANFVSEGHFLACGPRISKAQAGHLAGDSPST